MDELVEKIRSLIREQGFLSSMQVAMEAARDSLEGDRLLGAQDKHKLTSELTERIPCEDIRVIEYANAETAEYRRKDLFYYNPDPR